MGVYLPRPSDFYRIPSTNLIAPLKGVGVEIRQV